MVERWQRWIVYGTAAVSTILNAGFLFVLIFQCGVPGNYLALDLAGKCLPPKVAVALTFLQAGVTTASDLIFATLPVFIVWKLHVNKRTKVTVYLIMSLAALGSICSAIRFQYISHNIPALGDFFCAFFPLLFPFCKSHDADLFQTDNVTIFALWSTAEAGTGIIAACLITLKPLVAQFLSSDPAQGFQFKFRMPTLATTRTSRGKKSEEINCPNKNSIPEETPRPSPPMRGRKGGAIRTISETESETDLFDLLPGTEANVSTTRSTFTTASRESGTAVDEASTRTGGVRDLEKEIELPVK